MQAKQVPILKTTIASRHQTPREVVAQPATAADGNGSYLTTMGSYSYARSPIQRRKAPDNQLNNRFGGAVQQRQRIRGEPIQRMQVGQDAESESLSLADQARIEQSRQEEGESYLSQSQEAGLINLILLEGHEGPDQMDRMDRGGYPIPKQIHRFWTGGPLSRSAMENLVESVKKTKDSDWRHNLWYSSHIETLMNKDLAQDKLAERAQQRDELTKLGYNVRPIESLAKQRKFLMSKNPDSPVSLDQLENAGGIAYKAVAHGHGSDDIKYFSDIARLLYLHEIGGIHMDVDVGLGDIDLGATYYHQDEVGRVPLFGSLLRDSKDKEPIAELNYLDELKQRGNIPPTEWDRYRRTVQALVLRAKQGSAMYNALLASRHKNPHVKKALERMFADIEGDKTEKYLRTGMGYNKFLLTGSDKASPEVLEQAFSQSVPPYLLRLRHLTPESDT
ncbi:hypothetical protein [Paraherbaspirillum soli]|uniref:Uncharacterized protein n=1 Tax=Paraherbaspirillum soli TaxID=631222 RepID=A0ABW0MBI0_9BURK